MSRPPRKAFTLIEIVAVIGVMGIIGALISATMTRQQRIYRAMSETIEVRRSVRDAIVILAAEIRGASVRDTLRLTVDSAMELFTGLGVSVSCGSPTVADVALAPLNPTGLSLTSWLATPDTGDLAWVHRAVSSTPGVWERYRIRAVSTRSALTACAQAVWLASAPGASASSYVISLSPPPQSVQAGAPIRIVRRGRYSIYKSSDGNWYLGYRRCNAIGASSCGSIQPVSGYYRPYSTDSTRSGILFRYFDSGNHLLSPGFDPLRVASVQILARALSPVQVTIDGHVKSAADSTIASASLRNSP